jgi:putative SOS response-associated peptidase YedK
MCNRVATPEQDELQGYFDKQAPNNRTIFKVAPYDQFYNADGFTMPFLPITTTENPDEIVLGMWKLIPHWVKDADSARKYANTLNARSEDIFNTASFKPYIGTCRALLWVKGFFEPNHPKPKVTVPYFVKAHNSEPFTIGCVFSNWVDQQTGEIIKTFAIITTPPNELLGRIHNEGQRMPLIITEENRARWLGSLSKEEIIEMMKPLPDGYLDGFAVSSIVYKRGIDTNVPEAQVPV